MAIRRKKRPILIGRFERLYVLYEIADDLCRFFGSAEAAVDAEVIVGCISPFGICVVVVIILTALVGALYLIKSVRL